MINLLNNFKLQELIIFMKPHLFYHPNIKLYMKNFTFLFLACLLSLSLLGQKTSKINFGNDQQFDLTNQINQDHPLQLNSGTMTGDFSGLRGDGFVKVEDGSLRISDSEGVLVYKTETIDITDTKMIHLELEMSGIGTLDKSGLLHDWANVFYVIDGKKQLIKHASPDHTFSGHPGVLSLNNLKVDNQSFHLEIAMRVTGPDEMYSIDKIEIHQELKLKTNKSSSTLSTNLLVFPNPVSDYLYISNSENYQLDKIEIISAQGKSVGNYKYPIDIRSLNDGNYFIRIKNKSGEIETKPFIVLK